MMSFVSSEVEEPFYMSIVFLGEAVRLFSYWIVRLRRGNQTYTRVVSDCPKPSDLPDRFARHVSELDKDCAPNYVMTSDFNFHYPELLIS